MSVYANEVKQALALIKAKGQVVVWEKHTVNTDGAQPWKSHAGSAAPTFSVSIVFLTPKLRTQKDTHLMENTTVPEGTPRGLMGVTTGFVPQIDDVVIRGTERLTVKDFNVLAPNGEVILYNLEFS